MDNDELKEISKIAVFFRRVEEICPSGEETVGGYYSTEELIGFLKYVELRKLNKNLEKLIDLKS